MVMTHFSYSPLFVLPKAKPDKGVQDMEHLDFKIVVEPKEGQSFTVILVASSRQEKSAWTSDISQARLLCSPLLYSECITSVCLQQGDMGPGCLSAEWLYSHLSSPLTFPSSPLQCIDNIRCNGLMMNAFEENSKVTVPQMIK